MLAKSIGIVIDKHWYIYRISWFFFARWRRIELGGLFGGQEETASRHDVRRICAVE